MKKTLLLLMGFGMWMTAFGQCLNADNGQYPTTTYVPASCDGTTVNSITTLGYASEYSVVTVTQGMLYKFASSIATDFITISADSGATAAAYGVGSVYWVANMSGDINFYTHLDANCGGQTSFRARTVVCGSVPSCLPVTSLIVSNITSSSAAFSWADIGDMPLSYDVYLTTSSAAPDANTQPSFVVNAGVTDYQLNNLTDATTYYLWIRSNCGNGQYSTWTGGVFITLCNAVTSFYQGFDDSTNFPVCWAKVGSGGTANIQANTGAFSTPNVMYLYSSSTTSLGVVKMPSISNPNDPNYRLRFQMRANFTAGGEVEVGYLANPDDDTSFISIQSFVTSSTTAYDSNIMLLPGNLPEPLVMAFRHTGNPANSVLIDDVFWEQIPTCEEPSSLTASAVTSSTISINWDGAATLPGIGYEYYISTQSTMPNSATVASGSVGPNTLTYVIPNLSPATTYYIWIRSACASNDHSIWSNRVTATTSCVPVDSFTQNFDASLNMPTCWAKVGTAGSANVQATTGTPSQPNNLYMYSGSTTTLAVVSMPEVNNAGAGTHRLKFKTRANFTVGGTLEVGYLTNPADDTSFVPFTNIPTITTTSTTNYDTWVIYPGTQAGNYSFMAFRHTGSPAYSVLIDDVVWEAIPSCLEPDGLASSNITMTTATITWNMPNTPAMGYEYYVSNTNIAPNANTVPTGSVSNNYSSADLTGLSASTIYFCWVRSNCGNGGVSAWSQMATFTTLCDTSQVPYTQDFETATVPDLPICTTQENVGNGNTWKTVSAPGNGFTTKALQYTYNSTSAADVWFYTNPIQLTGGTSYTLTYMYGNNSTTFSENLKVAYGTSANSTAMTNPLADHNGIITGAATNNSVTFTPATTGSYVIGFNCYSDADQYNLYLDNIALAPTLGKPEFESIGLKVYPNPGKDVLNLVLPQGITKVACYNVMGQMVLQTPAQATEVSLDVNTLPSGSYLIQVTDINGQTSTVKWMKK